MINVKLILIVMTLMLLACNNGEPVTSTKSSDSSIKAIDPKGTIRDTSQYPVDSIHHDSATSGLTH